MSHDRRASTAIAERPRAEHPGGCASMMMVDREISSVLRREERARNLRRLVREPIVAFPLAGALGHFLVWLF